MRIEKKVFDQEKNTSLTAYIQEVGGEYRHVTKRPGILIIPGGAYQYCSDREGEPVAFEYLKAGFQAFILRYTVRTEWPEPLEDYEKAMEIIRDRADEWNLYVDKIAVIGFSAGGHLAACAVTMARNKPAAGILGYAAIDCRDEILKNAPNALEYVDGKTAPCFLFATRTDQLVSCRNTIDFSRALAEHGVCFESHIYSHGPHGLVTGDQSIEDSAIPWPESYHHWVQDSVNFLRDIFGHFEKGGMSAPRVRAHDTGDDEDYLSAHCTIGKLLSSQEGKSAMEDIMPGLRDGYEGWKRKMNEKYHTNLDIGQPIESYVLSTLWNMLGRDSSMLMELQKRLEKIPNDQSL